MFELEEHEMNSVGNDLEILIKFKAKMFAKKSRFKRSKSPELIDLEETAKAVASEVAKNETFMNNSRVSIFSLSPYHSSKRFFPTKNLFLEQ